MLKHKEITAQKDQEICPVKTLSLGIETQVGWGQIELQAPHFPLVQAPLGVDGN